MVNKNTSLSTRPSVLPNDVQPTDDKYRYPVLDVRIGEENISTAPPEFVESFVVRMHGRLVADYDLTLFDRTWSTIPKLLEDAARQTKNGEIIKVSFGWNIPGQRIDNLKCTVVNIGFDVTENGIRYKIFGNFALATPTVKDSIPPRAEAPTETVPNEGNNKKSPTWTGNLSDVVKRLIATTYGKDIIAIVEPTNGKPTDVHTVDMTDPLKWANLRAQDVEPARPHSTSTGVVDAIALNTYRAYFDVYGRFHFHTPGYLSGSNKAIRHLRYPYPLMNNPVVSMSFGSWQFTPAMIAGLQAERARIISSFRVKGLHMDHIEGETTVMEGSMGVQEPTGGGVEAGTEVAPKQARGREVRMLAPYANKDEFVRQANIIQQGLATHTQAADAVVLGDIDYDIDHFVRVTVTPPNFSDQ